MLAASTLIFNNNNTVTNGHAPSGYSFCLLYTVPKVQGLNPSGGTIIGCQIVVRMWDNLEKHKYAYYLPTVLTTRKTVCFALERHIFR